MPNVYDEDKWDEEWDVALKEARSDDDHFYGAYKTGSGGRGGGGSSDARKAISSAKAAATKKLSKLGQPVAHRDLLSHQERSELGGGLSSIVTDAEDRMKAAQRFGNDTAFYEKRIAEATRLRAVLHDPAGQFGVEDLKQVQQALQRHADNVRDNGKRYGYFGNKDIEASATARADQLAALAKRIADEYTARKYGR